MVPIDYALGDIFRDGEEVVVILRGEDGQLFQEQQLGGEAARNGWALRSFTLIWARWWCTNGDCNGSYLIIFAYAADNMNQVNSYMDKTNHLVYIFG